MNSAAVAERQVQADVNAIPLDRIDVSVPRLYEQDTIGPYFTRLRREDPAHYCAESLHGPYWSVTKFNDIVRVEVDHQTFSSESKLGGVVIDNINNRVETQDFELPMFIAMDPPKHDEQRKVVSPIVAPPNLALLEPVIRERAGLILDSLPVGEEIDWVDLVSIELTTMTLATLFDFPWEDRRKLTRWSDVATATPATGMISSWDQWKAELVECAQYFKVMWDRRVNAAPKADLVSMLAHSPATRNMPFQEFLGNLMLLIVGGNDTTRSSISGGVIALNRYPDQYRKLMADPSLIPKMVPEIIRWQTPLAHMRRTALADAEIGGKKIKAGDKVVMWYLSGNRDEEVIDRPEDFIIDRATPRHHLSFGFGIHRCVGNRLAEMQLRIIWEEIVKRYRKVEVVGEPVRTLSNFIHGFTRLPVKLHAH